MTVPSKRPAAGNSASGRSASGRSGLLREARLSRVALESNLDMILAACSAGDVVVDVRADAYGHGLEAMVERVAKRGIRRFRASPGVRLPGGLVTEVGPDGNDDELAPYGFADPAGSTRLHPVLSLVGEILAVKRVAAGSAISYGYTYRTQRDSTIALVGLGYADGIPRLGSNLAHATVSTKPALVAGRIAMDQFVLDLAELPATLGDEVIIWGDARSGAPTVTEWATVARRAPQNLTAGIGHRVERSWVDE